MSRVFQDGFEHKNLIYHTSTAISTLTYPAGRRGTGACVRLTYTGFTSGTNTITESFPASAQLNEGYIRFAAYVFGDPNAANINYFQLKTGAGVNIARMVRVSDGTLSLYAGGNSETLLASGISATDWHLFQIYWKCHNSTGSVIVKMDGVTYSTVSGNIAGNSDVVTSIVMSTRNAATSIAGDIRLDDVAINSTAGSVNNTYPADADIIGLFPNGNGNSSQWVGSDGNSTDNYLLVDEAPPNTTDYVSTSTVNHVDMYNITDITVPAGREIVAVQAHAYGQKANNDDPAKVKLGYRQGSTDYFDTAEHTFSATLWQVINGDIREVAPDGSNWSESIVDALQIGVKKTN